MRRVLYRPFGEVVPAAPGESAEPPEQGFTGQRFQPTADLYDYGARWYHPSLGRFLQPDPLVPEPFNPQSLNRYSYVLNDPVNRADPTGMASILQGNLDIGSSSFPWPEEQQYIYINESRVPFTQPAWESAGSIDPGLGRSDPGYYGNSIRPDPIYTAQVPSVGLRSQSEQQQLLDQRHGKLNEISEAERQLINLLFEVEETTRAYKVMLGDRDREEPLGNLSAIAVNTMWYKYKIREVREKADPILRRLEDLDGVLYNTHLRLLDYGWSRAQLALSPTRPDRFRDFNSAMRAAENKGLGDPE